MNILCADWERGKQQSVEKKKLVPTINKLRGGLEERKISEHDGKSKMTKT